MRTGILAVALLTLLASCGTDIRARCAAQHGDGTSAADRCVTQAENAIRNKRQQRPSPNG